MLTLKNFTQYTPEYVELMVPNAIFIHSEDGHDWYFHSTRYAENTMKLVFNEKGVITSMHKDATMLWPIGQSVTELPVDELPEGVDIHGGWVFNGEAVVPRVLSSDEQVAKATVYRDNLIAIARRTMTEWQTDLALGDISDEDMALLRAWNTYVKALKALDLSTAPDIEWPAEPATS